MFWSMLCRHGAAEPAAGSGSGDAPAEGGEPAAAAEPAPAAEGAEGEEGEEKAPAAEASAVAAGEQPVTGRNSHAAVAIDKDLYVFFGDRDGDLIRWEGSGPVALYKLQENGHTTAC